MRQATKSKGYELTRPELEVCRLIRPHEMTFRQQVQAFATSSITILTHGAAAANVMFVPKRSGVIEYVWHSDFRMHHEWTSDTLQDFDLETTFIGLHPSNPLDTEWMKEVRRGLRLGVG